MSSQPILEGFTALQVRWPFSFGLVGAVLLYMIVELPR